MSKSVSSQRTFCTFFQTGSFSCIHHVTQPSVSRTQTPAWAFSLCSLLPFPLNQQVFLYVPVHSFPYFCLYCSFCNIGHHAFCQNGSGGLWMVSPLFHPCPFLSPSLSENSLKPKAKHAVLLLMCFHRFSLPLGLRPLAKFFRISVILALLTICIHHNTCTPSSCYLRFRSANTSVPPDPECSSGFPCPQTSVRYALPSALLCRYLLML